MAIVGIVGRLAFMYNLAFGYILVWVGPLIVKELKRIVEESEITK